MLVFFGSKQVLVQDEAVIARAAKASGRWEPNTVALQCGVVPCYAVESNAQRTACCRQGTCVHTVGANLGM
jgi:hypothetical protein